MDLNKIRELLIELSAEYLEDEDLDNIVELAGRGGSQKGRVQRVSSAAGVKTYGVPIGTLITRDTPKLGQPRSSVQTGGATSGGVKKPPAGTPGGSKKTGDVADQFNNDPNVTMRAIHVHPRVPGAKFYEFSDGTAVVEDIAGVRSKRAKVDPAELKAKGWNIAQEMSNNVQENSKVGSGSSSGDSSGTGVKKSGHEMGQQTLARLEKTTKKPVIRVRKSLNTLLDEIALINEQIRKGSPDTEDHMHVVDDVRGLLNESVSKEPVTVYRGMSFRSTELRDQFVDNVLTQGSTFTDKGFTLASANPDKAQLQADGDNAKNPGMIMNIAVPSGSRVLSVSAAIGKDDPDQGVLLVDKAKYSVDSVSYDVGGRPIVEATYLDPKKPKEEQDKDKQNPIVTPEAKDKAQSKRFVWDPNHIDLSPESSTLRKEILESGQIDRGAYKEVKPGTKATPGKPAAKATAPKKAAPKTPVKKIATKPVLPTKAATKPASPTNKPIP